MKRQFLLEQYNEHAKCFIPESAGPEQRKDTQAAFYAGAVTILKIIIAAGTEMKKQKEALILLDSIVEELKSY